MAGTLKFTDNIKFSLLDPNLIRIKDHYEEVADHAGIITALPPIAAATQPKGLAVHISATHAGIITGNNGFYLPDRMKKGTSTFTDNFHKPVLLHHESKQDSIGRVTAARYIDTSGAVIDQYKDMVVKDKYGKEIGVINDTLINDFCSGKMPYGMAVDTVRTMFRGILLDDEGYNGLGHIQIIADIVDPEAIKKLLDGRYLTGSVGASTNSASCSICRQDWTELGQCEHKPGGIYDSQKCFIIAGDLSYNEYSFVNKPADRHSRVLELNYNGILDSIELANEYPGRVYEVQLQFPQFDDSATTKEEQLMKTEPKKDKDGKVELQDSATTETDPKVDVSAATEGSETQVTDATDNNSEVEETTQVETEGSGKAPVQDEKREEEAIESIMVKVLNEEEGFEFTDEIEEKLYDLLWTEVLAVVNDGDIVIEAKVLEDAKLSTSTRKKLPKTTFCGPSRSFPVPDCAHVIAARRLIGRAKISDSTKSSVLACVSRKAKALGCPGGTSKKDSVQDTTNIENDLKHSRILRMVLEVLDGDIYYSSESVLDDDEKKMLTSIIQRMAKFVGKDAFTEAAITEGIGLSDSVEQTYVDEITKYEDVIGELRDRIGATRQEYTELSQDYQELQDSIVEGNTKARKEKESYLSTLRSLRDTKVEEHDYTKVSDEDLQSEIDQVLKTVDMNKITDKLGDGMSRTPEGEVENPTEVQDDTNNSQKKKFDVKELEIIDAKYNELLWSKGGVTAESFLVHMRQTGKLPQIGENI